MPVPTGSPLNPPTEEPSWKGRYRIACCVLQQYLKRILGWNTPIYPSEIASLESQEQGGITIIRNKDSGGSKSRTSVNLGGCLSQQSLQANP